MKKILIIGSAGFIGKHLVQHFKNCGFEVFGCDLLECEELLEQNYFKILKLVPQWKSIFANNSFDYCINAAGSGNVAFSVSQPIDDFEANTFSVAVVLDAIRKFQPNCKYIHISSAAVYGNPHNLPIVETNETEPVSPYGYHKLMSELLCKEYYHLYKLPVAIVRPFSVFGNGLKKQLLWDICEKLNKADTIILYGTGNESRDFLHVTDLCELLNRVVLQSGFKADFYNAATGIETNIRQVADIFEQQFNGKKKILFSGEVKAGDPINWRADVSKISLLDFKPVVLLEKGIKDYISWYFSNL